MRSTTPRRRLFNTDIHGLEIWRSDDAGVSWRKTHDDVLSEVTYTYGYYFGQIRVAPNDAERIYVLGMPLITSSDGGKTFSGINPPSVHVDHHAWWIDAASPSRMIGGNDGGLDVSYDGGKSWLKLDAQPVGQFYTVGVDMAEPFNIYGGLQDNGTWKGSSEAKWDDAEAWSFIGGGDGMHVAVDPRDASVITGYQFGFYRSSKGHEVRPREKLGEPALRYNWNTPVILSPHNADVVYFGANRLFRSFDQGKSWSAISPDLTTSRNRGDVPYATITSLSESPKQFGLIWAGTDDGQVWVTSGGGNDWREVSAKLPRALGVARVRFAARARARLRQLQHLSQRRSRCVRVRHRGSGPQLEIDCRQPAGRSGQRDQGRSGERRSALCRQRPWRVRLARSRRPLGSARCRPAERAGA